MSKPPNIPSNVIGPVRSFMQNFIVWLTREFDTVSRTNTAQGSVLLASPNGSVYSVWVGDDGTITTTLVVDKS